VRARGAIIVFPAFFAHRVTAVTKGTRLALVGWIHGDSFV
jgi:PKHD-type hydroxylase